MTLLSFGQNTTITGTVKDTNGALPGTNVVVKDTPRGVATDIFGNYSIKAAKGETLVFTVLGMCDETKTIGDTNTINVTMQEEPRTLETVILPYYSEIKKRTAQSISCGKTVTAEEIQSKPKQESKGYTCRAQRTIKGNDEALIVIDNKISSEKILKKLDPEKIKSINVLKGAEGAALYGSDGVNGVIIITTKDALPEKGRSKKKKGKS